MTDRQQVVEAEAVAPHRPVLLRQARESAGLHVAALAAALKVPVPKLEALEAGRYEELPDMTFARALAASACRHLKVDPAAVLTEMPTGQRPSLGDTDSTINAPFKPASVTIPGSPLGWLSRPAVLGAIALLLGALVILLLPRMEPAADEAAAPGAPTEAPAAPVMAPGVIVEPVNPAAQAAPADSAAAVEPAPALAAPAAVAPADGGAPASALLSLKANATSWVKVTSGTGAVVLQRELQPGERVDLPAALSYAVELGKADAVEVTVRGQRLDTAPLTRGNVARFEVK